MAGNVTPIRSEGQVRYRLAGAVDLDNEQVAYRLGQQSDARRVSWIGVTPTAEAVGVTPGATVTGADAARVYALMAGVNPVDGEVLVAPKVAVGETAKLAAVPGYDAIVLAAAERGRRPEELFLAGSRDLADWLAFARQVEVKGDTWRVPVTRLEALGGEAGVDVAGAYRRCEWVQAVASKDERVAVGIKGYDVGLTLPKGASLDLVMADPVRRERLAGIAQRCAGETFTELGERVAYGAKGHHGGGQAAHRIDGTGFVGTVTMEATSRAGDPHVHFHSMIANLTICTDGVARTIGSGGRDVLAHGPWASERFRMKYRAATAAAGLAEWGWNEATGEYDALTISGEAMGQGSKRHAAIAAEKAIFGPDAGKAIDAMAERITREAKPEEVETFDQIAARFGAELAAEAIQLHGSNTLQREAPASQWTRAQLVAYLDSRLTEHNAVFTEVTVQREVQRLLPADLASAAAVDTLTNAYLADKGVLEARQTGMSARLTGGVRYTTQAMLDGEGAVYAATAAGVGHGFHQLSREEAELALATYEAAEGFEFNPGQQAMFARWTTGGHQVDLVIGAAGTGKTAAADAARYAWQAKGLNVLGISTSGLAAANLAAAAGVDVTTAAGLAKAIEAGKAPDLDVLIWDEMGMASTREQAVIVPWAAANGVDVRGMGDPKQLDSVGAGSTFSKQCEQVAAVELSDNMRQRSVSERAAVEELRVGDTAAAFNIYAAEGQIRVAKTPADRVAAMVAAWAVDAAAVDDPHARLNHAVMLAQTNAGVAQLHDAARAEARARGWITGPDVTYRGPNGSRQWAVGDTVLIRKTRYSSSGQEPAVFNGQRALVTGIDPDTRTMAIAWTDTTGQRQQRHLDPGYVAEHTAPGFALTNHAAQGQTINRVHVDPQGADRNAAYVQLTRDKDQVTIWTDLTTLGAEGRQRVDLLKRPAEQQAAWAARQLAERVDQWGWTIAETAHDATNTPVPTAPTPTVTRIEAARAALRGSDDPSPASTWRDWDDRQLQQRAAALRNPVDLAAFTQARQDTETAAAAAEAQQREWLTVQQQATNAARQQITADIAAGQAARATLARGPGLFRRRRGDVENAHRVWADLETRWGPDGPPPDHHNTRNAVADFTRRHWQRHGIENPATHTRDLAEQAKAAAETAADAALRETVTRNSVAFGSRMTAAPDTLANIEQELTRRSQRTPLAAAAENAARQSRRDLAADAQRNRAKWLQHDPPHLQRRGPGLSR